MYGWMYVCVTQMHLREEHTQLLLVCMYVCMYGCMYVWMYVCMDVCMYVWMYVCMCDPNAFTGATCPAVVGMYVCMYVWMYVCMYV